MKLLTTTHAAKRLGVTTARIRQYVAMGLLVPVMSTPTHLFEQDHIDAMPKQKRGRKTKGS